MDFVRYANQGATRNKPISSDLVRALDFLPELGVTMEVFSGGQDAEGPNRVGSTRHDHGQAADVFFYKDGRKLDWASPDDRPLFEEIVKRGRSRGITGFGAGDGYMQPGSMHIGFGGEAVWGAGGKGANAPEWLRAAYYGADAPQGGGAVSAHSRQPSQNQLSPLLGELGGQATAKAGQGQPNKEDENGFRAAFLDARDFQSNPNAFSGMLSPEQAQALTNTNFLSRRLRNGA